MLLEEGFEVVSCDASDKMLKYALQERWDRRKQPAFDKWSKLLSILHQNIVLCFAFAQLLKKLTG